MVCSLDGCDRKVMARGLCNGHYSRQRRGVPVEGAIRVRRAPGAPLPVCRADGCGRAGRTRGLCDGHYKRWSQGRPLAGPIARRVPGGARCEVAFCGRVATLRGLCREHRRRLNRHGDVMAEIPIGELRGNGSTNSQGYRAIYRPDHPAATAQGMVLEHRCVMAEYIGRPLHQDESVHHRNGNRDDNRIENLELWAGAHGPGARVTELVPYAVEILERYAPQLLQGR